MGTQEQELRLEVEQEQEPVLELELELAQVLAMEEAMVEKELEATEEGFPEARWQVELVDLLQPSNAVRRTAIGILCW